MIAVTIMESTPAVDSSSQIWSVCLSHADKFDRALVETWKGDMDGILIFVGFHIDPSICLLTYFHQSGLFSAVVTAFLIASYPALQPDLLTINANLTAQVVTILFHSTNQSEPDPSAARAASPEQPHRLPHHQCFLVSELGLQFSMCPRSNPCPTVVTYLLARHGGAL
jgi:Family of unknown function (DUF6535)